MIPTVILASQSPRRKQLLEWAHINFEVKVSGSDESFPPELSFEDAVMHIARNKALAIQEKEHPSIPIIAADTIVVCEHTLLGKPANREEAIQMLQKLSGKSHEVITGVVICTPEKEIAFTETTQVQFHSLTREQIIFYVDQYQPYDKAGGYAIQEWIGVVGIQSIKGDFYNVMGLPVSRVVQALSQL